jgi:hypothetical protein
MSPVPEIDLTVTASPLALVDVTSAPGQVNVIAGAAVGPAGPQGPPGAWTRLTQAEYDALPIKDPTVLYVIVG